MNKPATSIRLLSLLGFLLLFAPFYDSCNGKFRKVDADATPVVDSVATNMQGMPVSDTLSQESHHTRPVLERCYDFIDDDHSENAFEFAQMNAIWIDYPADELKQDIQKGIKANDYSGFFFALKNAAFLFIVLISFCVLIFSFCDKAKTAFRLTKWNIVLLCLTVICLFLEGWFETISQIKWGYYAFFVTQAALFFYLLRKTLKTDSRSRG